MNKLVRSLTTPPGTATCRGCGAILYETFADLGVSPLSNSFITLERIRAAEKFFPLHAWVCARCFLVQLEVFERPEDIFDDYLYFSAFSGTWQKHCAAYAERMTAQLKLGPASLIVEVASNDGTLLSYFHAEHIPVLGVEPARTVAHAALDKGIRTEISFFGAETGRAVRAKYGNADLIVANNVLAHVPDIHDFIQGSKELLAPNGMLTAEFPHLLEQVNEAQFDTIYHEHFSYLSLYVIEPLFAQHALNIVHVDRIPTHGGSLRIYARHAQDPLAQQDGSVEQVRNLEAAGGLTEIETYRNFSHKVRQVKSDLLSFLIEASRSDKTVAAYGAPAKGNTLLNYCGIKADLIAYTCDRNPHKQGKYLPGSRLMIEPPERIFETKPDYLLILPWNLKDEIMAQMAGIQAWGGKFVTAIPRIEIS